ncbi:MAG: ABC transporter ATP-binding protein [Acholeplasmatales bacterium]|nr:ABC transporter ATP-binding protein [Acholeplasmatales bacterium]
MEKILEFIKVNRKFKTGDQEILACNDLSFSINKGEFCLILGPSGSGKSTLLNILGGMDKPNSGQVIFKDQHLEVMNDKELTNFRKKEVGFVFQFYNLMPNLNARENVQFASELNKSNIDINKLMKEVGLNERMNNFPSQLSGGEQQRVSIARAIAKNPQLILCDEPTGALDYLTGKQILSILIKLAKENSKTLVIVSHNTGLKAIADRVLYLHNGQIVKTEENTTLGNVEDLVW